MDISHHLLFMPVFNTLFDSSASIDAAAVAAAAHVGTDDADAADVKTKRKTFTSNDDSDTLFLMDTLNRHFPLEQHRKFVDFVSKHGVPLFFRSVMYLASSLEYILQPNALQAQQKGKQKPPILYNEWLYNCHFTLLCLYVSGVHKQLPTEYGRDKDSRAVSAAVVPVLNIPPGDIVRLTGISFVLPAPVTVILPAEA